MFGAENRVKVLDFGLSRRTTVAADDVTRSPETLTEAGVIAGTLAYMSPEVLRGGTTDERADLWVLAVTLFNVHVTRPFEGATSFEERGDSRVGTAAASATRPERPGR